MHELSAILSIVIGVLATLFGFTAKQFYAAKGNLGVTMTNGKLPLWVGRLLGLVVGGFFILIGVRFFVTGS